MDSQTPNSLPNMYEGRPTLQGPIDFLNSNGIVAKVAFLILVLIIFVILLRVGLAALSWWFTPSPNPFLIDGMIDGRQLMRIPQDPSEPGAVPVLRSDDNRGGLVFTWSIWVYIDDLQYNSDEYRHIFHKGGDAISKADGSAGLSAPLNAPGLYIAPGSQNNKLVVVMNTFDKLREEIEIPDVPLNKWLNVIIRIDDQRTMDVYINGRLTRRRILASPPRQNYGDVYLSLNGGFSGYSSCLRYFDSAIGTKQIQSIVADGPCLNMIGPGGASDGAEPKYLSLRWFFAGQNDMYNP